MKTQLFRTSKSLFASVCALVFFSSITACHTSNSTSSSANSNSSPASTEKKSASDATKSSVAVFNVDLFSNQSTSLVSVENPNGLAALTTNSAEVALPTTGVNPGAEKAVTSVTKNIDASNKTFLTFEWKDTWRAALNFQLNNSVDLTSAPNDLAVDFDFSVEDLQKGGVALKRICNTDTENNCGRQVPFLLIARSISGQGWQHFSVPYACFFHDEDSKQALSKMFSLEAGGTGKVSIANLRLTQSKFTNVACPDYKTQSVTPSPLNEWWSIEWWMPRHEKKLIDLKANKIDLVFVGDSITEGWEKSGAPVWKKYYAKRNAIALGFGGDRTENLLWRLQHGEIDGIAPKLVVMMIGTNNTGHRHEDPQLIAKGIERDIAEIQKHLSQTKILLLAIFPRDATLQGDLRINNEKTNALISQFSDNKKVFFLNINQAFLNAQGELSKDIMPDLLHPNEKGYEIWAKAMDPTLTKLLK